MTITNETELKALLSPQILSKETVAGLEKRNIYSVGDLRRYIASGRLTAGVRGLSMKSLAEVTKFFSEARRNYLHDRYEALSRKGLSIRTVHFVDKKGGCERLVELFDQSREAYQTLAPGRQMTKTLDELYRFNQAFKGEYLTICRMDEREIGLNAIALRFGFLTEEERRFVLDFRLRHGVLPVVYILYRYMPVSQDRGDRIYALRYAMKDGQTHTVDEVGRRFMMTRERARQIVAEQIPAVTTLDFSDEDLAQYDRPGGQACLGQTSPEFLALAEKERLEGPFTAFAALLRQLTDTIVYMRDTLVLLVRRDLAAHADLDALVRSIDRLMSSRNPKALMIDSDVITADVPEDYRKGAGEFVRLVLKEKYGVSLTSDGYLSLPQNTIDVSMELYQILEEAGHPMHLDDLFREFKKRYPDYKYTSPAQIRHYLLRSDKIGSIGKTSTYGLLEWDNVYFGSIRDLLSEILSTAQAPLSITDLMDRVHEIYPRTTRSSVESTMASDPNRRFTLFEGNVYGIAGKKYGRERKVFQPSFRTRTFDERIQKMKEFIGTNGRFPYAGGEKPESKMYRWLYNFTHGVIETTAHQRVVVEELFRSYPAADYPRTQTEYTFKKNCEAYLAFVKSHGRPPGTRDAELYQWFFRAGKSVQNVTDARKEMYDRLIEGVKACNV